MKKLYSTIATIALVAATIININAMNSGKKFDRSFLSKGLDAFMADEHANWPGIFLFLNEFDIKLSDIVPFTVNQYISPRGVTLLYQAAEDGNHLAAKMLIERYKAYPNGATKTGMTPLMIACFNGDLKMVKLLLHYGADPYIKNNQGHDSFYFITSYYQMSPYIRNRTILNMLRAYRS